MGSRTGEWAHTLMMMMKKKKTKKKLSQDFERGLFSWGFPVKAAA
jgi:hypothetical protein